MEVDIYYNLHKSCWSIRAREGEHKGRVICHAQGAEVAWLEFVVQEAGRARVVKEGRKNVHAFVRGTLVSLDQPEFRHPVEDEFPRFDSVTERIETKQVSYNPYKHGSFYETETGVPIVEATYATLTSDRKVYV